MTLVLQWCEAHGDDDTDCDGTADEPDNDSEYICRGPGAQVNFSQVCADPAS